MAEPDAGIELTLLDTAQRLSDARLAELYSYPTGLQRCWVRSNFIASLDGGATSGGKSGGLGGPGDKALFGLMREQADVIVVGAGTARTENYGGAKLSAAARNARRERGQSEVPPIAIVTQSGHLDNDMLVFTQTEVPPLVLTAATSAPAARERLGALADVVDCSGADSAGVDIGTVLHRLAERGLLRVLTEGGPSLHDSFIEAGLLDELCLSLAPVLVGGQARRIATGANAVLTTMRRGHLLSDDAGYLYTRYVRE